MDTLLRNSRVIPVVIVAATTLGVASAPRSVEADESILQRVVGAVSPRRAQGPVERLHRRIQQRPEHRNDYHDGLAVHGGGAYAGQMNSLDGHRGTAGAGCRGGHCNEHCSGDHCIVRPDRFGYYGTHWRQWPGARVVQTAGTEALTPASPPRLELPTEKEESLDPKAAVEFGVDEPVDESDATTLPGLGPVVPPPRTAPAPRPALPAKPAPPGDKTDEETDKPAREPEPPAEGEAEPPAKETDAEPEPKPEPKPTTKQPAVPAAPSADDNLFDEASHRRRLHERLAVIRSEARPASPAPEPFSDDDQAKPVPERTSMFLEADSADVSDIRRPAEARPAAFSQEAGSPEANPLRISRERGWRSRPNGQE